MANVKSVLCSIVLAVATLTIRPRHARAWYDTRTTVEDLHNGAKKATEAAAKENDPYAARVLHDSFLAEDERYDKDVVCSICFDSLELTKNF